MIFIVCMMENYLFVFQVLMSNGYFFTPIYFIFILIVSFIPYSLYHFVFNFDFMFLYFIYSIEFSQFYYIILIQINFKMYFVFYCHFFILNFLICIQYHDYLYYYEVIFMMRRRIFFDDLILLEACFMLFLLHLLRDRSLVYSSFLLDVYFLYFVYGVSFNQFHLY
jgi:hypothetical protein